MTDDEYHWVPLHWHGLVNVCTMWKLTRGAHHFPHGFLSRGNSLRPGWIVCSDARNIQIVAELPIRTRLVVAQNTAKLILLSLKESQS